MQYSSGRAAIRERMTALLRENDELPEADLLARSTVTGDHKKAQAVFLDLVESEELIPGNARDTWRLHPTIRDEIGPIDLSGE